MDNKTATVSVRVGQDVKLNAERIIGELGLTPTAAINIFYKQIVYTKGIPFDVTLPKRPKSYNELSKEELRMILEKGVREAKSGKTKSSDEMFDDLEVWLRNGAKL